MIALPLVHISFLKTFSISSSFLLCPPPNHALPQTRNRASHYARINFPHARGYIQCGVPTSDPAEPHWARNERSTNPRRLSIIPLYFILRTTAVENGRASSLFTVLSILARDSRGTGAALEVDCIVFALLKCLCVNQPKFGIDYR